MATLYWKGGGVDSRWSTVANWSTASAGTTSASAAPTSADDVVFDGLGATGNTDSTVTGVGTIRSLYISSSYTAVMTHQSGLTISGSVFLTPNYTIAGVGSISISANSTITTNGVAWPNGLTLYPPVATLVGDLTVKGLLTIPSNRSVTVTRTASENLIVSGGISLANLLAGSAKVILAGGTWSTTVSQITNNIDITGDITVGTNAVFGTGKLTYITGSVTTAGSTLQIGSSCTLDVEPVTWNNLTFTTGNTTILSSSLNVSGSTTVSATTTLNTASFNPTASLNVRGGVTVSNTLSGTAKVTLISGSWTGTGAIRNNTDISGNISVGNAQYGGTATNVLRYVSGSTTITGGTTFTLAGSCILDVEPIRWNNIDFGASSMVVTLSSSLNVPGSTGASGARTTMVLNTASLSPTASLITNGLVQRSTQNWGFAAGTAKIILTGGSWGTGPSVFTNMGNDVDISGSIAVSGTIAFAASKTVTWITGSVSTRGSTLNVNANAITMSMNTPGVLWDTLTFGNTNQILFLAAFFSASTINFGSAANPIAFSGSAGFLVENLTNSAAGVTQTITFQAGTVYYVTSSFTSNVNRIGANTTFTSNSATTQSVLILSHGATCNTNANFTRIDASQGRPIRTWNGTITDCVNVEQITDLITAGSSFVNL